MANNLTDNNLTGADTARIMVLANQARAAWTEAQAHKAQMDALYAASIGRDGIFQDLQRQREATEPVRQLHVEALNRYTDLGKQIDAIICAVPAPALIAAEAA